LARKIKNDEKEEALKLVTRLDETAASMSGMLNALLDINQIEAGNVHAETTTFPINELFERLKDEFMYHAEAQELALRVVPCSLWIHTDQHLLEQMIRNLISNALKYTSRGKVLLGCRRHKGVLSVEIWDTGIGIADKDLQAIFEEFHQVDNVARERSRGLGLGLSIVQRLGELLGHTIRVHSQLGKGSVFAIEVSNLGSEEITSQAHRRIIDEGIVEDGRRTGSILIIEDDPEVRALLELFLKEEGFQATSAPDGVSALKSVRQGQVPPDLILADFNLPNGMNGVETTAKLREKFHHNVPVVILTGDISTDTLRNIARHDCVHLNKPVKLQELTRVIERLLHPPPSAVQVPVPQSAKASIGMAGPTIFVVDDDSHVREAMREVFQENGQIVESYATSEAFLQGYRPDGEACLLIDAYLPGMKGLELLQQLRSAGDMLPAIMITGNSDVSMAVKAMKAGASDFIEKPVARDELLASVGRALEQSRDTRKLLAWREAAARHIGDLTPRQSQIMELVLAGHPSKNIATDLGISQRTVENHRAKIMEKTGTKSLPALARLAFAAAWNGVDEPLV
jgi:two-component system, chemotaxis family, CheB/CheR fusion protein